MQHFTLEFTGVRRKKPQQKQCQRQKQTVTKSKVAEQWYIHTCISGIND